MTADKAARTGDDDQFIAHFGVPLSDNRGSGFVAPVAHRLIWLPEPGKPTNPLGAEIWNMQRQSLRDCHTIRAGHAIRDLRPCPVSDLQVRVSHLRLTAPGRMPVRAQKMNEAALEPVFQGALLAPVARFRDAFGG